MPKASKKTDRPTFDDEEGQKDQNESGGDVGPSKVSSTVPLQGACWQPSTRWKNGWGLWSPKRTSPTPSSLHLLPLAIFKLMSEHNFLFLLFADFWFLRNPYLNTPLFYCRS